MRRRAEYISFLALAVFFMHGAMYLIYPDQLYNGEGWIVLVKYVCVLVILLSMLIDLRIRFSTIAAFSGLVLVFSVGLLDGRNWAHFFQGTFYLIPLSALFAHKYISKLLSAEKLKKWLLILLMLSFFSALYELLLGGVFSRFSGSGFRSSSIFVNPNNAAIAIAILSTVALMLSKNFFFRTICFLLGLVSIILTGSKTGFIVFAVGALYAAPGMLCSSFVFLVIAILATNHNFSDIFSSLHLRSIDDASGDQRLSDWSAFLNLILSGDFVDVIFGPYKRGFGVDNNYLDMWYNLGLIAPIVIVVIQVGALIKGWGKNWNFFFLHLIFILSMLTTDVLRLWPLGYIFWYLVGQTYFSDDRDAWIADRSRRMA